jgi:hypothetical protein
MNRVAAMPKSSRTMTMACTRPGCGRPVVDWLRRERLPVKQLVAVVVTGGHKTNYEEGYWHVPKRDLVGAATASLENGRLKIARGLKEGPTLLNEMRNYKLKVNIATGHESFEAWRERDHDDIVFSVCLICWFGTRCQRRLTADMFGF